MTYSGFFTTEELLSRYKIAARTLNRWQHVKRNKVGELFPKPTLPGDGGYNRWSYEDIESWERG